MPKVSVIVPVYNVEKYLGECMDSILAQTLEDIEVICVDDGSTDGSAAILDDYASRDNRVRVIHKENAGYGAAMNTGLDAARGEYIAIVESDDFIDPDMYERLVRDMDDYVLDVVKCDCIFFWNDLGYEYRYHSDNIDKFYHRVLVPPQERRLMFKFLMNVWAGMYSRSFLLENKIRFRETPGASYQDNGFWLQVMSFANRMMAEDFAPYHYRQDNPTQSIRNTGKLFEMAEEYDVTAKLLEERGLRNEWEILNHYRLVSDWGTYHRISDENKWVFLDKFVSDFSTYYKYAEEDAFYHNWYSQFSPDPEKYTRELIEKKQEIMKKLSEADSIVVYGAGKNAEYVLRYMYNLNMFEKLQCFVTSGEPERDRIGKYPVHCIYDEVINWENAVMIFASARKVSWKEEAVRRMQEVGITDWIEREDISERFYCVV